MSEVTVTDVIAFVRRRMWSARYFVKSISSATMWRCSDLTPLDTGRTHVQVCHSFGQGEWARDDDGDGIREVHTNSIEGFWTGLRNFLRPFRGVNKEHLSHDIAVHEWASNLKHVTDDFLRAMMWRFTF